MNEYECRYFWKDKVPVYRAVFDDSNPEIGIHNITLCKNPPYGIKAVFWDGEWKEFNNTQDNGTTTRN